MAETEKEIFPKGLPESDSLGDLYRAWGKASADRRKAKLTQSARPETKPRPVNIAKAKKAEKMAEVRRMGQELRSGSPVLPGNPGRPLGHALRPEYLAGLRRKPTS